MVGAAEVLRISSEMFQNGDIISQVFCPSLRPLSGHV